MSKEKEISEFNEDDLENVSGGMISFEPLQKLLEKNNITTHNFQEKYGFNPAHLERMKYNHDFLTKMVNKLCEIFNCEPSDIIEIIDADK